MSDQPPYWRSHFNYYGCEWTPVLKQVIATGQTSIDYHFVISALNPREPETPFIESSWRYGQAYFLASPTHHTRQRHGGRTGRFVDYKTLYQIAAGPLNTNPHAQWYLPGGKQH